MAICVKCSRKTEPVVGGWQKLIKKNQADNFFFGGAFLTAGKDKTFTKISERVSMKGIWGFMDGDFLWQ